MEIEFSREKIVFNRVHSSFDGFVMDFCDILQELGIRYVLVSGYVAIFFGRSRTSEDVDMIVEKLDPERFRRLWEVLGRDFECLNTRDEDEAYQNYLLKSTAIRFAKKGKVIPNMEFKFTKTALDEETLERRVLVKTSGRQLFVSPIELQVAFKLFLGSEKDFEDARFLYQLFREKLDQAELGGRLQQLDVDRKLAEQVLGGLQ